MMIVWYYDLQTFSFVSWKRDVDKIGKSSQAADNVAFLFPYCRISDVAQTIPTYLYTIQPSAPTEHSQSWWYPLELAEHSRND
jgi:hypothetical protein